MKILFMFIIFALTFLLACSKRHIKNDMREIKLLYKEMKTGEVK